MDLNKLVYKDQTIKIVPSVEESLNIIGLNTNFDDQTLAWFTNLKTKWKTWKKSLATDLHFDMLFQFTPDPYRVALVCIVKCEFKDCKPKTLPYYIMEMLNKWSLSSGILPEDTLKLPAFQIATQQRNQHFLNLILRTYKVNTIKDKILPIVQDMLKNDNHRLAIQIIVATELYDEIPVENLLYPLVLQDKPNMIDEYLSECPNQVKPFLLFLDNILNKNFSLQKYAQKYIDENNISNVKFEKVHYKPLGKLVARLCNKFNIPIETCKNLSKNRTRGGLRYLIYRKYLEHNVSSSVWEDLVKDSLSNSSECIHEFIDMLVEYDIKEAHRWAAYFNVPEIYLPLALKNLSIQEMPKDEENWDTEENIPQQYYKLSINENKIKIIDTAEKFYDTVSNLIKCNIISIDCEWKPSFGATQSQIALIQIASCNCVYLIDTILLNDKQYLSFWYRFNKSLLDNAEIIKLGFGLEQDLKEIRSSINGLNNIKVKGEGFLDLGLLWRSLINFGLSLPSDSDSGGNSLSSLVQACFGLPLEKAEQCSNWELRPLRQTQIYYAALDAYVLLDIYYYLQKLCSTQQINFDQICNDIMLEQKVKSVKKVKVVERLKATTANMESKQVNEFKILVESELSHLVPYFRYCGIDTLAVASSMLWHDVIDSATSANRAILTNKLKCSPNPSFSQNLILDVGQGSIKDQIKKTFSYFKIIIKQSDFLTRCLNCNVINLKKLTINEVIELCNKYKLSANTNRNTTHHVSDYEEDENSFENFLSDSDGEESYLYQPILMQNHCLTNTGARVEITNAHLLCVSQKQAELCESCGKLYWDEDPLVQTISEIISSMMFAN